MRPVEGPMWPGRMGRCQGLTAVLGGLPARTQTSVLKPGGTKFSHQAEAAQKLILPQWGPEETTALWTP